MLSKNWVWLLFCILIGSCVYASDMPFPRCIAPDYFGPKPITVKAGYSYKDQKAFMSNSGKDGSSGNFHSDQVVKWQNTGLVTNGKDLVIRVRGSWTAWNKNNTKESKHDILSLEELEQIRYKGIKKDDHKKSLPEWDHTCTVKQENDCDDIDEESGKIPCWFTNGKGAYLLFKKAGGSDPNDTLESMRTPKYPTIHIGGKNMKDGIFHLSKSSSDENNGCTDTMQKLDLSEKMEIYVKILDNYYFDNIGGYSLEVLSGASANSSHAFNDIYGFLKRLLLINNDTNDTNYKSVAQEMFDNIIHKGKRFKNLTISSLCLFIVISVLLYIFGMVRDIYHDFIFRIMKIALVVTLLSPDSFKFFYDHFFALFIHGLELFIKIISPVLGNSRNAETFDFMDDMFWTFTSYATVRKIVALFLSQLPSSIFFVLLIFLAIIIYLILCIYMFVIFLTGFVGIAFLIAIMPLFLLSILFSPLKELFQGWLNFLISLCLKAVMMYALLALFYSMIIDTFYKQLGFTVCYNQWLLLCIPQGVPVIGSMCLLNTSAWTMGQVFVPYLSSSVPDLISNQEAKKLSMEGGKFKFTGGKKTIHIPPEYSIEEERYVDYPYYNPIIESDRISEIQAGGVIKLLYVFVLVLMSFLIYSMRSIVQSLSSNLAGGGFSVSDISSFVYGGNGSKLINLIRTPVGLIQHFVGTRISAGIGVVKEFPDKFAGGTAKLVGRVPRIGGVLETGIEGSRKVVKAAALTTQMITTPQHNVKVFEKKLFKIFGIDEAYLSSNNKYDKYLDYYRMSVGAHLGYALGYDVKMDDMGRVIDTHMGYAFKDAVKFGLQHDMHVLDSRGAYRYKIPKDGPDDKHVKNVFYMALMHRADFMMKLRAETLGAVKADAVRRKGIDRERKREDEK